MALISALLTPIVDQHGTFSKCRWIKRPFYTFFQDNLLDPLPQKDCLAIFTADLPARQRAGILFAQWFKNVFLPCMGDTLYR